MDRNILNNIKELDKGLYSLPAYQIISEHIAIRLIVVPPTYLKSALIMLKNWYSNFYHVFANDGADFCHGFIFRLI